MAKKAKLVVEHADVLPPMFRNFRGEKQMYNNEGQRNFKFVIERDIEKRLLEDGVTVNYLKPRDEDDEPTPFVKVNVRFHGDYVGNRYDFAGNDPAVYLYSNGGKKRTRLHPNTVGLLDTAEIENWDLVCTLYERQWDDGKTTVTLYLEELHAMQVAESFADKYSNAVEEVYGPGYEDE